MKGSLTMVELSRFSTIQHLSIATQTSMDPSDAQERAPIDSGMIHEIACACWTEQMKTLRVTDRKVSESGPYELEVREWLVRKDTWGLTVVNQTTLDRERQLRTCSRLLEGKAAVNVKESRDVSNSLELTLRQVEREGNLALSKIRASMTSQTRAHRRRHDVSLKEACKGLDFENRSAGKKN